VRLSSRLQDLVYRENEVTCTTGWQEIVDKLNFFTTEAHKNVAAVARHEQNIAGLLEELNVASWVCAPDLRR